MTDITANVIVSMPSQLFTMARSFKAVANGKIYIGKIDTDPVNPENQIQVYVENEDGSHVPVSQPIIINAAGYPVYNGQIAKFVTVQGHSMAVYDAYGAQQFYFPNVLKYDPDQLREELSSKGGFNLVGELGAVSDFYGMESNNGDKVLLKSWYRDGSGGGGIFEFNNSIIRAKHDGGCIISPSVPYIGDAYVSDYVNGVGDEHPSSNGCWVRRDIKEITGEMYGMHGNPDDNLDLSPNLRKAISAAGVLGVGVVLPGNIINLKSPVSIPIHQREGGKVAYIRGVDEKLSIVNILASETSQNNFGIYLDGSLSVFSSFPIENLTIRSVDSSANRSDWSGFGLNINKCIRLSMRNVLIDGFEIGCKLKDSLYLEFNNCRFTYNKTAIQGRLGEVSGPNSIRLSRCDFQYNAEFCIENQHAHAWKIDTCTFEANGGKSYSNGTPIAFNSCVQFALIGGAGRVAATIDNCYFESNTGSDVSFYINRNLNQIININNSIFNYNLDSVGASRVIVQSNQSDLSSGVQCYLNMMGNGFLNTGASSESAFKEVQFVVPSSFGVSHLVFTDFGNQNSMKSPYSGLEKVQRNSQGLVSARANISSTGSYSLAQNISNVSRLSPGTYKIDFTFNVSTLVPNITLFGGSGRYSSFSRDSDYSITVKTFNNTGANVDLDFIITVM
ncbi:TPA: phage head-binding domain-containing protein [Escherichia coli]